MASVAPLQSLRPIISPFYYLAFRLGFGLYLAVHFAMLIPYGGELFSSVGMLPAVADLPTYPYFPNLLFVWDEPWVVVAFLSLLTLASLAFAAGYRIKLAAILLWYGWACLLNRNIFIRNAGMPYVGWLLLASVFIPPVRWSYDNRGWRMPQAIWVLAWIFMALGYSLSGLHKLASPSWLDGSALARLLDNPLSRPSLIGELMQSLPEPILQGMSWTVLLLELSFAGFALIPPTRRWIWLALVLMHLGMMATVDFVDLSLGMLMIHFFTWDDRWLPAKDGAKLQPIVFFDGDCGFCNSVVHLILDEDHLKSLRFASLQGETARSQLAEHERDLSTLVVKEGEIIWNKSDAFLVIVSYLGGGWRLAAWGRYLPKRLRDRAYLFIAKNRHRIAAPLTQCRLPDPEDRARFLA